MYKNIQEIVRLIEAEQSKTAQNSDFLNGLKQKVVELAGLAEPEHRYFKYSVTSNEKQSFNDAREGCLKYFFIKDVYTVVQIVLNPGDKKKGRAWCRGIHEINRITFSSNYNYKDSKWLVACTKEEYEEAKDKILTILAA